MITVKIRRNSSDDICEVRISGHANYSEQGTDIVCAGVSALAITTINSLDYHGVPFQLRQYDEGLIDFAIISPETEKQAAVGKVVLTTFWLGIKNMVESYDTYIRLVDDSA